MSERKQNDLLNDMRQSPIGFFNLGVSYLDAADALTRKQFDKADTFQLFFDSPIRHLYAHAWELFLKACIFRQGMKPSEMKRKIGHSLTKAWDEVDKSRFALLDLHPQTRTVPEVLDQFHMPPRMYAYPITGSRREFTITFVRAASQRFRISRRQTLELFG